MTTTEPRIDLNWRGGLEQLVNELRRQKETRVDFVADARSIRLRPRTVDPGKPISGIEVVAGDRQVGEWLTQPMFMSDRALAQLGERVTPNVPPKFARALASERPAIASELYNRLLDDCRPRVLLRCLDGRCRAALSSKYRVFDDLDIAMTAADVIMKHRGTILECTATEARMEIKFTALHMVDFIPEERGGEWSDRHLRRATLDPGQFRQLGPGAVTPFVRVTHSAVGEGGLGVGYGILRLRCINGAVTEQVMNQIHLGGAMTSGLLSEETVAADSKATMLKARDMIKASLEQSTFAKIVDQARDAAKDAIEAPTSAVANIVEAHGLTEADQEGILRHFLRDYDQNRWGLSQAVSRWSQDTDDAEAASNLERVAGRVLVGS